MTNYRNEYNRVCDQLKWLSEKIDSVKDLDELKMEILKLAKDIRR